MSNRALFRVSLALTGLSILGIVLPIAFGLKIIAVVFVLSSVFLLPVFFWAARTEVREAHRLMLPGNYWAHWQYGEVDPDNWKRFAQAEWSRARTRSGALLLQLLGVSVIGLLFACWRRKGTGPGELLAVAAVALIVCATVGLTTYLKGRYVYKRRLAAKGEVYIGPEGVYCDERYTYLRGPLVTLVVKFQEGHPSELCFNLTDRGVRGGMTREIRVMVPSGNETEARKVARRFTTSA